MFNMNIFLYNKNYLHLSDDKKEIADIKKICIKIANKYDKYFYKIRFKKHGNINQ